MAITATQGLATAVLSLSLLFGGDLVGLFLTPKVRFCPIARPLHAAEITKNSFNAWQEPVASAQQQGRSPAPTDSLSLGNRVHISYCTS